MSETLQQTIKQICEECGNDRTKMMDIVTKVQKSEGCVSSEAMELIAKQVNVHRVEVEGVVSFYAFLSKDKKGDVVIRLCNDIVDKVKGVEDVAKVLSEELGVEVGETSSDGKVTLEYTPCIGMCDQAPAALINDVIFPNLTVEKAKEIASALKSNTAPADIPQEVGDGNNADELVKSAVVNNVKKKGAVIFDTHEADSGLKKALDMSPEEVIAEIKAAKLRGRGGAGFPTGLKWEFTRGAAGDAKYILCNADEGEPGTFKDRVLLTELYDLMFEGMTIGGYAIGAEKGIVYLRGEYAYLRTLLEAKLKERREKGLLGNNILGKEGVNFDICIYMGAGAYICGEETALISSCEGLRGDPKNRPPFPAQKGYLESPTSVNNVETFCCAARIMSKGASWFAGIGSEASPGTKLLSISGACTNPGIYEFDFGVTVADMLKEAGADNPQAVLVGGPSGQFIGPADYSRTICYNDLATGGSVVIFCNKCNLLDVVDQYMDFFVEESCGYCTPCRAGNVLLKNGLDNILAGKGEDADIDALVELSESVKVTSRCGLGQTSPNPILTTIKNFRPLYEALVKKSEDGMQPSFDIKAALSDAENITGRDSVIF